MASSATRVDGELVVVVLSADGPGWAAAMSRLGQKDTGAAVALLFDAVASFLAAHVGFSVHNRAAIVACGSGWSSQAFPPLGTPLTRVQGPDEPRIAVTAVLEEQMEAWSSDVAVDATAEGGAGAGKGGSGAGAGLASALSRAVLVCGRHGREVPGAARRVLVVAPGSGTEGLYVPLLNAAFAARDDGVVVDVLTAADPSDTAYLQQVAHETGGASAPLDAVRAAGPLQHLLTAFGPSAAARTVMAGPVLRGVDLRASCMLTGRRVSEAFVCFVCLGVFGEYRDVCPVCGTKAPDGSSAKRAPV